MRRALPFPALCFLLEAIGRRPLAPPPGRPASPALRPRRFPHPAWLVPPPPHPVRPPRPPGGGAVALGTQRPRGRPPLGAGFPAETGTPGRTQRRQRPFGGRRGPSACGSSGCEDPSYRPGRAVTAPGAAGPSPGGAWGGQGGAPALPSPAGLRAGRCGGRRAWARGAGQSPPRPGSRSTRSGAQTSGEGRVQNGLPRPAPPGCLAAPAGAGGDTRSGETAARGRVHIQREVKAGEGAWAAPGAEERALQKPQAPRALSASPGPAGLVPSLLVAANPPEDPGNNVA